MANLRTAWHVLFVASISEHGAPGFDVLPEQLLSAEPLRADVVVVRRMAGARTDGPAGTLKGFWPQVRHTAVVEFKSPTRPVRPGEVAKLFGYGGQYHALHFEEVGSSENLLLVLVVASITNGLVLQLEKLRLTVESVAPGYLCAQGRPYTLLVVDLSAVVDADEDELMAIFVRNRMLSRFATRFMEQHRMTPNAPKSLAELEEYHEVVQRWLSSLTPAERLEGLSDSDVVLALPDSVLQGMTDEYLRALPPEAQEAIRRRIGRPT
jgi:hypothetical protein